MSFTLPGYTLHGKLGAGAMGEVYLGTHRLSRQAVAVKRVLVSDQGHLSTRGISGQVALMQEFQTLASMHHPNVIRVLDYGFDEAGQPYVAMELLLQARTLVEAAEGKTPLQQMQLLAQLLQALVYLQRRGIVHRDIKPTNVLVNEEGVVKLLDFGVAVHGSEDTRVAGTYAYLAPEVVKGAAATFASDLFAVGLLAFEMLYGYYPFAESLDPDVAATVIENRPVTQVYAVPETPGPFGPLVRKLLAAQPKDRYHDARDVMTDLAQAGRISLAPEGAATRDSILQSSRMVGRDEPLSRLLTALSRLKMGHGSAALVAGESGVGKSRLLEELRTQALVRGVPALVGECMLERGTPYAMWVPLLRYVCVHAGISDAEASVLATVVADVDDLIERPVRRLPSGSAQDAQARLFATVRDLLLRLSKPVLVILEDLHWVGPESLDLLLHLTQDAEPQRLLLVSSYRINDGGEFATLLPHLPLIILEPLDSEAITDLCHSMLGITDVAPSLVKFLQRETEGNVFFLVEVLRALAEKSGDLRRVEPGSAGERILTGGMQQLLLSRLEILGPHEAQWLQLAAVAGRQLDLTLLRSLINDDRLEEWLLRCANAEILARQVSTWRFAHDKLRDAVLQQLDDVTRMQLHDTVANAVERQYADNLDAHVAALAFHRRAAGQFAEAATYFERAGHVAEQGSAYTAAREYYLEAAAVLEALPDTPAVRRQRIDLLQTYMESAWSAESPDQLLQRVRDAEMLMFDLPADAQQARADGLRQGRLAYLTGRAMQVAGDLHNAVTACRQALDAGEKLHDSELTADAAVTMGQLLVARGYVGEWRMIAKGLERGQRPGVDMARAWAHMVLGMSMQARLSDARQLAEEAHDKVQSLHDPRALAMASVGFFWVPFMGEDWQRACTLCDEAVAAAQQSGDRNVEFLAHGLQSWALLRAGERAAAARAMERAQALLQALGGKAMLRDWVAMADLEARLYGDPAHAMRLASSLAQSSAAADLPVSNGLATRAVAQAMVARDPDMWAKSDALFAHAVKTLDACGAFLERARTEIVWGRMLLAHNQAADAEMHLIRSRAVFTLAGVPFPED